MCGILLLIKLNKIEFKSNLLDYYKFKYNPIDNKDIFNLDINDLIYKYNTNKGTYKTVDNIINRLKNRGPDSIQGFISIDNNDFELKNEKALFNIDFNDIVKSNNLFLFISSVLSLRKNNNYIIKQPLKNKTSILLYNGEIYSINKDIIINNIKDITLVNIILNFNFTDNDTLYIHNCLDNLFYYCLNNKLNFNLYFNIFIKSLNGDYAIVYYNMIDKNIYVIKDYFGKRNLFIDIDIDNNILIISSINCRNLTKNKQLDNNDINSIDLKYLQNYLDSLSDNIYEVPNDKLLIINTQTSIIQFINSKINLSLNYSYNNILDIVELLIINSIKDIIQNIENKKVSILFSGGIDCSLILFYCLKYYPNFEIDLLNISFSEDSFDRKNAISSYNTISNIFPNSKINLVLVNKNYSDLSIVKDNIIEVLYPCDTQMDYNIAVILYFSTMGIGKLYPNLENYTSNNRIYLSGLGADELFGGYSRYRIASTRDSTYSSIQSEMEFDIKRLWIRNLARDDRIVSANSKEMRYPFLNKQLRKYLKTVDIKELVDFNKPKGEGEKALLRQLCYKNNLQNISKIPKKAMQFGTNISKIINKAEFGSNRKGKGKNKIN